MKKEPILIIITIIFCLTGCGGYPASINFLSPEPSPISVRTLPATPTPFPSPLPTATVIRQEIPPTITVALASPTALPTPTPLPEPSPTFTPEPDWLHHAGRLKNGLMFLGNPDAPVKFIDFSDFM